MLLITYRFILQYTVIYLENKVFPLEKIFKKILRIKKKINEMRNVYIEEIAIKESSL